VAAKYPFTSTSTIKHFFGKRAFLPLPVQERKWEGKKGKRARRLEVKTVVKGKKENRKPAQTTVGHICSLVPWK